MEPELDDLDELIDDLAEDDSGLALRVSTVVERRERARRVAAQRCEADRP